MHLSVIVIYLKKNVKSCIFAHFKEEVIQILLGDIKEN